MQISVNYVFLRVHTKHNYSLSVYILLLEEPANKNGFLSNKMGSIVVEMLSNYMSAEKTFVTFIPSTLPLYSTSHSYTKPPLCLLLCIFSLCLIHILSCVSAGDSKSVVLHDAKQMKCDREFYRSKCQAVSLFCSPILSRTFHWSAYRL